MRPFTVAAFLCFALGNAVLAEQASGAPIEDGTQQAVSLPAPTFEPFAGEIEYDFDTLRNVTHARFQAPLDTRGLMGRLFLSAPAVRTVTVQYDFIGHRPARAPEVVELTFVADEYGSTDPYDPPAINRQPVALELNLAGHRTPYGVGVAEHRVATIVTHDEHRVATIGSQDEHRSEAPHNQISPGFPGFQEFHIVRTSTSRLTICEFLGMIGKEDVTGRVANQDFVLNHRVIIGLRKFVSQMTPAESDRDVDCSPRGAAAN